MFYPSKNQEAQEGESQWISISDLMSVLMMIFLFIAISYMINVVKERERIKEIAVAYNQLQDELYQDLHSEFENDLEKWNASIDRQTLSIKFESPEVLFEQGSDVLRNEFRTILMDFFPRYINILTSEKYIDDIEEIRIEGHTSSEWATNNYPQEAYIGNMKLSQDRTREVLAYVLLLDQVKDNRAWIKDKVTANGLSSSKLVITEEGEEDKDKSRRVEFRVRTNAEKRMVKILTGTE
ncbi:outer membrane protein OmpA-like peptidoglycan-associated protein [Catalinimonas alkaloidigena]|uniref:OmpA/MotB family protein n=1 Tax=Catalinimonas alkaloidigena TaxID=1075417 RepID=UPI002405D205|nr:OmpA family protein [Catalinimonas alkaloidigena]MDF9795478.1 outer membrane protein OmpA-like peptidoglycan-associated protein [Catalinimonas alkaloidigena]